MKLWISRILIILVLLDNFQAALQFMFAPGGFVNAFDLSGAAGTLAIQSMGILFLMWCIPYIFAAIHPIRHRVSLIEAVIMQAIGLIGEGILFYNLPSGMQNTPLSLQRFMIFDATGLIFLLAALWLSSPQKQSV